MSDTQTIGLFRRPYMALLIGQVASRLGDSVYEIGLLWLVFTRTGSGLATGVMLACETVPAILFTLPGGVLADRFNRRALVLFGDLARALIPLGLGLTLARGLFPLSLLYAATFLLGSITQLHNPALQALFPSTVGGQELARANAIFRITEQAARIVGPLLGGILVATGPVWIFYANALSFLVAGVLILGVPNRLGEVGAGQGAAHEGLWQSAVQGIRYVLRNRVLWILVGLGAALSAGFAPLNVAVPALISRTLGLNAQAYGRASAAVAAGMFLGAGTAALNTRSRSGLLQMRLGVAAAGAAFLAVGLWPTYPALFGGGLLAGFCIMFSAVTGTTLLQSLVPDDRRGRVFAVMELLISSTTPAMVVVGGASIEVWRPEQVVSAVGVFIIASAAASALISRTRERSQPSGHQA